MNTWKKTEARMLYKLMNTWNKKYRMPEGMKTNEKMEEERGG